jgi:hypothetical protein
MQHTASNRREFLGHLGSGLGGIALASLMQQESSGAIPPPFAPKAKRVIQLFMNGGASQCDLFDYKPQLIAQHGQNLTREPECASRRASAHQVP